MEEYKERYFNFEKIDQIIINHNQDFTKKYKLGHNQFSDQHQHEIERMLTFRPSEIEESTETL